MCWPMRSTANWWSDSLPTWCRSMSAKPSRTLRGCSIPWMPKSLPQRAAMFAREAPGDIGLAEGLPAPMLNRLTTQEQLTAGDFANVCRQRELLDEALMPEEFLRLLVQECRWKSVAA